MKNYFVCKEPNPKGDHIVHLESCLLLEVGNINLGLHINCERAVVAAKSYFPQSNGCSLCCTTCHTI